MQNVFVENTDSTQDIHIEDSAAIQYSIVVEDVAEDILGVLALCGMKYYQDLNGEFGDTKTQKREE